MKKIILLFAFIAAALTAQPLKGTFIGVPQVNGPTGGSLFIAPNSSPSFSPAQIPGMQFWFDANDASTIHATGSAVNTWDDKSGNGYNATATVAPIDTPNAVNGRHALLFDPANMGFAGTDFIDVAQPWTLVAVVKTGTISSTEYAFLNLATSMTFFEIYQGQIGHQGNNGIWRSFFGNTTFASDTVISWVLQYYGANPLDFASYVSTAAGIQQTNHELINGTGGPANFIGTYNGSQAPWKGYICELIMYKGTLFNSYWSDMNIYINAKWLVP